MYPDFNSLNYWHPENTYHPTFYRLFIQIEVDTGSDLAVINAFLLDGAFIVNLNFNKRLIFCMEESMEDNFQGIYISDKIIADRRLNWTEKILLEEIKRLDKENNGCPANNTYLAKHLQITESRISQIISKLKKLKYIKQESFDGRTRILKSLIE